ncbi:putative transcription factor interactor and regulator CCHC(Zn) family [Helianthus anomalus]
MCFKCQEFGHIAWNCPNSNTKQGVVFNSKLVKKNVNDKKQPTKSFKKYEYSTFEISEISKCFYK